MATLLADNAYGTLASGLAAGDTTLTWTAGHGARFPAVTGSDVLYVTILNSSNVLEEVIITAHTSGADTATITRAAGSTTAKAWVAGDRVEARISKTALTSFLMLAGGNLVGGLNDAKTTVASAATPDIFATSVGGVVDYTGTATCTGFVAAPQAGAKRTLICAGACLFTAGANLLIEGIPSGATITLAANAIVKVVAITTTQFKMTYSVSGSFTATGTGFTVNPTATATYIVVNGVVNLYIPEESLTGTSNAVSFTITGLPDCIKPTSAIKLITGLAALNNGAVIGSSCIVETATNVITLYAGIAASGSWTSSNAKKLYTSEFAYRLA